MSKNSVDLSYLNKNKDIINKTKEEYETLINQVIEVGIDLDSATEVIIKDFRIKSEHSTKQFYKLSKNKKSTKKDYFKFYKKNIYPLWKNIIEDKFEFIKDYKNILSEDIYYSYLIGMYIVIHSKAFQEKMEDFVKFSLAEMSLKAAVIVSKEKE